jgi:hypothetical protein
MATVTASKNWVSGETVTPAGLNLTAAPTVVVADNEITTAKILDANVTAAKLAATLDLSSKTVTLPDASVAQAKLAANVAGNGPAFRAYANSTTTIAPTVATKITLGAEDFDTASCFASSRFTPNVEGYYQINAGALLSATSGVPGAPYFAALIYKNGSFVAGGSHSSDADSRSSTVSDLIYLNGTTDYVELYANHFSSGNKTVRPGQQWTWLSGFLARAA